MKFKELCQHCGEQLGYCWFDQEAQMTALGVPVQPTIEQVQEAQTAIAGIRIVARDKFFCPNVNSVHPKVPGQNLIRPT